ncbi:MAG: DUF4956 domain-containing protein [Eubacterium sp.]|nr:DUF4956 domain-containing protein [Eubacterium sp.]
MNSLLFGTILENGTVTASGFWAATLCSLTIGAFVAFVYSRNNHCSASMVMTLIMLPAIVQLVIMMVNGNVGAGVAVAGAFSLVRFRSVAGRGQEITAIFLVMAAGLATGMGYLGLAAIFSVVIMALYMLLRILHVGERNDERELKITVPEDLDYEGVFDELLEKYTKSAEMISVKTKNMGSLYELCYSIIIKQGISLKQFMDEIRIRNGNMEVSCGRPVSKTDAL